MLLLGSALLPAAALAWMIGAAAIRTDQVAARHEERLAANGFEFRKREIQKTVMTETVWDEAVRNLDLRFSQAWADANMVAFFTQTSGFQLIYVVDADNRRLVAHASGQSEDAVWAQIHGDVARMVASIRRREQKLHRPTRGLPSKTLISDPVDATTVVRIGGVPYLLTAALVQPDFGEVLPSRRAPVVIVGEAIDRSFLRKFGEAHLLHHVRLVQGPPPKGISVLPIKDLNGVVVAQIGWEPDSPVEDLIDHIAAPLAALTLMLLLLPAVLFYRERRRGAQLQRARDAAEAASVAKSQFLANMSHEIRTPLNGVLGVAAALARADLPTDQREMVDLICDSAKSLEALLSDILDLARVESGALHIRKEPFDLATTVRACTSLFDAAAQAKGLDLHVSMAPEAEGFYEGDGPRLRQILCNLLSNAVKFTHSGSVSLQVTAARGETFSTLEFRVRDTGIGFDDETASRLFSRFEQGDGSITRRFGGSGLGRAISRALARAMGGDLAARSAPGEGSEFTLELVLSRCPTPVEVWSEAQEPAPCGAGLRVLLAEDHPTNRRVVELILGAVDVELTSVADGAQAVDAFRNQDFDLVLMDMQMPVMDGLSAIRAIRSLEVTRCKARTPIFVLTANAMPEHVTASRAAGADGHLSKPITPERLLDVVSGLASGRLADSGRAPLAV